MRKINMLFAFTAMILLAACQTKKTAPGADVKSITVRYTELGRQTMFRITCESFDKYFPKPLVMNIASKPAIDSMMTVLSDMKAIDNDQEPDVRGKIYITHTDNKTDTVCLGTMVLKYKQGTYETPQKLLMMIQQWKIEFFLFSHVTNQDLISPSFPDYECVHALIRNRFFAIDAI